MRVVSGSARGCKLQPVPGMNTRPTTDRVKENVFNLIQDHVRDADVLDLFAGTGQLGIEALSRGAAHCDFIEHNGTAYSVVSKNVQTARVQDRASLHRVEARDFLAKAAAKKYSLIFLWTRLPSVARLNARGPQGRLVLQEYTLDRSGAFRSGTLPLCTGWPRTVMRGELRKANSGHYSRT